ncbi:hypothetical protein HOY82DRAFT_613537 [Tuber indicum]|nr:hypothetical protein HOY82DRAFT_613537 [Tuber indicum]
MQMLVLALAWIDATRLAIRVILASGVGVLEADTPLLECPLLLPIPPVPNHTKAELDFENDNGDLPHRVDSANELSSIGVSSEGTEGVTVFRDISGFQNSQPSGLRSVSDDTHDHSES